MLHAGICAGVSGNRHPTATPVIRAQEFRPRKLGGMQGERA
jgi:hypothetical protein